MDEVKQKTDIVAVIGERVNLKKAGSNYKGLCPFHNEKTPSFMVSPEIQIFKCFGCQKSGDVFTFLQEYEGMEFYETLKTLADKAGIKLKSSSTGQKTRKDRLFEVNEVACNFYQYILHRHPAGKYALDYLLNNRQLTTDTVKKFRLGFSPDVPLALKKYAIDRKKIHPEELSEAGLVYTSAKGYFDRFRGRIIFPLSDHRGNVVGFAGRILPDNPNKELAKYINTPETLIYKKSQLLYGLNESKAEIKKQGEAVVTEGELDMISSFQAGIRNVVAIKGSALTSDQSRLLRRFCKSIVLALDADFAGNEAAKRGIFIAESEGLQVKVAELRGYKDPDDAARDNPEALRSFIEHSVGVWDFIIDFTFSKYKKLDGSDKQKIGDELIPLISQIENKITQSHYVGVLASRLRIPFESVFEEVKKQKSLIKTRVFIPSTKDETVKGRRDLLEERYLSLVLKRFPEKLKQPRYVAVLKTQVGKRIAEELAKYDDDVKIPELVSKLPEELKVKFTDLLLKEVEGYVDDVEKILKEIELVRKEMRLFDIKNRLNSVSEKIRLYEETGEKRNLRKAEKKFSVLTTKLSQLKEQVLKV